MNPLRAKALIERTTAVRRLYAHVGRCLPRFVSKAFGLASDEARARYWQTVEQHRRAFEAMAKRRIRAQFRSELKRITAALDGGDGPDAHGAIALAGSPEFRAEWKTLLTKVYLQTGLAFAGMVNEHMPKSAALTVRKDGTEPVVDVSLIDVWTQAIEQYIAETMGTKVLGILETTQQALRETLLAGMQAGEGVYQLTLRVEALYLDQIIPYRSEVIARTEVLASSNFGSLAAAKASGLQLNKSWLGTSDGREREWHLAANGQTVAIAQPFIVKGEKLMFPGDSSMGAGPDNVIQCRCTLTYAPVGN